MTETAQEIVDRLTGFTPGPWKFYAADLDLDGTFCGSFIDDAERRICYFGDAEQYYPTEGESPSKEDAALIASAPDLHRELAEALAREAALREAMKLAKGAAEDGDCDAVHEILWSALMVNQ